MSGRTEFIPYTMINPMSLDKYVPRVVQGKAGLALTAVTQAAEENRERLEKYVRT